eukprot:369224_1
MALNQWFPSEMKSKAYKIPKQKRIEYMVCNAFNPIPEHKFDTIYLHLFSESFKLSSFGRFSTITELIASIPNLYRTISIDGRAFIQAYDANKENSSSNYQHKIPNWSVNASNKSQIFGSMSITLRLYKGNKYVRDIDLTQCLLNDRDKCFIAFGRDHTADFSVQHPSISRKHSYIQFANDGTLFIYDSSTHGTMLNNTLIPAKKYVELKNRDRIRFGHSTRTYVLYMGKRGKARMANVEKKENECANIDGEKDALVKQNEMQNDTINEMQQMIEKLQMDLNCAQKTATNKSKQVIALMKEMECLKVTEREKQFDQQTDDEGSCSEHSSENDKESDCEEGKRVCKVKGIDFVKEINNLSKLTVTKLNYYIDENDINIGRVKKAELVKIIQKDIKKHFNV